MQADYVEAAGTSLLVHHWPGTGGRAVLYWHGGGGGSDEWPRIAPAVEAVGYSVYAPDAPGYGDSARLEPEEYLASNIADIAVALIERLGIAPVVWIGFSWGASIGFHAAVRHPGRLRALVLLDGGYLLPQDDPSYDPSLDFAGRMEAWRLELERQEEQDEAPIEIVAAAMTGSNLEPALPLLPRLAQRGIPVLLIAATEPDEWNEIRARRIEEFTEALPGAEVVRVQSGHGVLQDAGDDVRRILLDWLASKGL